MAPTNSASRRVLTRPERGNVGESQRGAAPPWCESTSAQAAAEQEQADDRLGVRRLGDGVVELLERPRDDLDALLLPGLGLRVREPGGQVEVDALVGEARRREEGVELLPVLRGLADLLGELALGGVERLLSLLVVLPGRDLERHGAGDLPRLADEPDGLVVVGDHPDRAGMCEDLAGHLAAV